MEVGVKKSKASCQKQTSEAILSAINPFFFFSNKDIVLDRNVVHAYRVTMFSLYAPNEGLPKTKSNSNTEKSF